MLESNTVGLNVQVSLHGNIIVQVNFFAFDHRQGQGHQLLYQIAQVDVLYRQRQVSGFDPRHIQNFINQLQQVLAGLQNFVNTLLLVGCQRFLLIGIDQLAESQNSVQGCAQFMAHLRQKLRLGIVGLHRVLLRLDQFLLCLLLAGDVFESDDGANHILSHGNGSAEILHRH